ARRAATAMSRFVTYSLPDDGGFQYGAYQGAATIPAHGDQSLALPDVAQKVVSLPMVVAYFRTPSVSFATDPTGRTAAGLSVSASADPDLFRRVDRPVLRAGRLPD